MFRPNTEELGFLSVDASLFSSEFHLRANVPYLKDVGSCNKPYIAQRDSRFLSHGSLFLITILPVRTYMTDSFIFWQGNGIDLPVLSVTRKRPSDILSLGCIKS